MRKYTKDEMQKLKTLPTQHLTGLHNEMLSFFKVNTEKVPMMVESIGLTEGTANYSVYRTPGNASILEYVLSGKGYVYTDAGVYTVREGDVYFLREETIQHYAADAKEPYTKLWINFNSTVIDAALDSLGIGNVMIAHAPDCRHDFEKLYSLANLSPNNEDVCCEATLTVLKILFSVTKIRRPETFAERVRAELDAAVYSAVSLGEIAVNLFVSRQHLTREFKKAFGESPYHYLLSQKLDAAKGLLKQTNLSVKVIAIRLGFSDENYFSNLFKSKIKMSPTQYRKAENMINQTNNMNGGGYDFIAVLCGSSRWKTQKDSAAA